MTGARDSDSTKFEIFNKGVEVAYGHLNNRSNFAHVTLTNGDDSELEDCLVAAIEDRIIDIR